MRRLVTLGALLIAAVAWTVAAADPADKPDLHEPLPFDHAVHASAFDAGGLECTDCHPVGLRLEHGDEYAPPDVELEPPLLSCHGCHLGELKGGVQTGPRSCVTCHADREQLVPASHEVGWRHEHGREARARKAECDDCHETHQCVDCHDARGALERNAHPPGFRTTHGVEARIDPYSCSSCHSGEKCVSCHTTGAIPW